MLFIIFMQKITANNAFKIQRTQNLPHAAIYPLVGPPFVIINVFLHVIHYIIKYFISMANMYDLLQLKQLKITSYKPLNPFPITSNVFVTYHKYLTLIWLTIWLTTSRQQNKAIFNFGCYIALNKNKIIQSKKVKNSKKCLGLAGV